MLNRNDAKGTPVSWNQDNIVNYWGIRSVENGIYDISYHFIKPIKDHGKVYLKLNPYHIVEENKEEGISEWTFKNVKINRGDYRLEPYYQTNSRKNVLPFYVAVKRVDK